MDTSTTGSIWTSPTVGWDLVTLPIVWQVTLAITIVLIIINYKLKRPLQPKKWQLITIIVLSLFSFWFIEYIQETMWIYQPCYKQILTATCLNNTFISAIRFLFPVVLWGYNAFVLIPRFIGAIVNFQYKRTLIWLTVIYLICGVVFLLKLQHDGRLQIFLLAYEQQYNLASPAFSLATALIIVITWPALLAIQLWAGGY